MKKLLALVLSAFILISSLSFATFAAPSGYSEYLDFESAAVGTQVTGWNSAAMTGYATTASDASELQTKVAKFSGSGWQNTYYNGVYAVETGKQYEFTAWFNHLSFTPNESDANKNYVGLGLGIFDGTSFSGSAFVATSSYQTVYNSDGSVKTPQLPNTSSYINISTNTATPNYLDRGVWYKAVLRFTATKTTSNGHIILRFNSGTTNEVLVDNVTFREVVNSNVTVNCKESAAVVGVSTTGTPIVGDTYRFKIASLDASPFVQVNGSTVTPDGSGIYSVITTANMNITVVCDGDETLPASGKDAYGNDLTAYNDDVYLKPVWEGDTVYHEAALFYTGRQTVKLLYPVDSVVSLRSYSLGTYYVNGVDYEITPEGLIQILPGSRIPVYTGALTTTTRPTVNVFPTNVEQTEFLTFIGDTTYPSYAIDVTYKHSRTWEDGAGYTPVQPQSQSDKLQNTIQKLQNGEEVNIAILGDSISCGWSSSGLNSTTEIYDETNTEGAFKSYIINVAPYAPTWMTMFLTRLQEYYPNATINVKNLALGGKTAAWGASNIAARLALWNKTPDLMLVGFGVNDVAAAITPDAFKSSSGSIVTNARTASGNSNLEFLFYSPMLPNTRSTTFNESTLLNYETKLSELADNDSKIGLFKLTSVFSKMIDSKEAVDYLNTNVNHGNDFTARIYATGMLASMTDEAAFSEMVNAKFAEVGTAVRTSSPQGLRFKTRLYKSLLTDGVDGYNVIEYGTIAIKSIYLGAQELVLDGAYSYGGTTRYPAKGAAFIKDRKNVIFDQTDTTLDFTGVLTGISESNYQTNYTVRVYVILQNSTGDTRTVYCDQRYNNIFEISELAFAARLSSGSHAESAETRRYLFDNILKLINPAKYVTFEYGDDVDFDMGD